MGTIARYWHITFDRDGRVCKVTEVKNPGHERWVVIEAVDEEQARKKGYLFYCAKKKRERVRQLHAEGRCACGRKRDREVEKGKHRGELAKLCAVCFERSKGWRESHQARVEAGTVGRGMAERDEAARIEKNLGRQRERRDELRLEVLVEVRQQWMDHRNVALFGRWLLSEIAALTGGSANDQNAA